MRSQNSGQNTNNTKDDKNLPPKKQHQTMPPKLSKQTVLVKSSQSLPTPTKLITPSNNKIVQGFKSISGTQRPQSLLHQKSESVFKKKSQFMVKKETTPFKMKQKKPYLIPSVKTKETQAFNLQRNQPLYDQIDLQTLVSDQNLRTNFNTTTVINNGIKNIIYYFKDETQTEGSIRIEANIKSIYSLIIDGFAIGEGAHSTVYKLKDQKTQESYAMKFIPWTENNDYVIQEINIMKLVKTDNHFIRLEDYFILKDGQKQQLAILMELGQFNLSDIIQFRRKHDLLFQQKDLCNHMLWLLQGLNILNENQICHRDLKPSNIVYCKSDNRFKITDFSEGKCIKQYAQNEIAEHTLRGTPAFFSPEMRDLFRSRASNGRYNPLQSDLYSLGLTFLCMATLDTHIQHSQILSKLESIKAHYGREIYSILQNLLDNNQGQRFQFKEILDEKFQMGNQEDLIVCQKMTIDLENEVANLENRFQKTLTIIHGYIKMQDYDNALQQCETFLQDKETKKSPKHKILILIKMSQIAGCQQNYDLAISCGQESLQLCNLLEDQSSEITGAALNTLGIAFSQTNATVAISLYKQAEDIALNIFGPFSSELSDVYNNIGSSYHRLQDYRNARLYVDKALVIKRGLLKDQDDIIGLCDVLNNVGIMCNKSKEYDDGEKHFIECLDHLKQFVIVANTNFHTTYLQCLANYTNSLIFQKKIELAEQILDEWQAFVRKVFGEESHQLNEIMGKYGMMCAINHDFEKASSYFSQSIKLYENTQDDVEGHLDILYNFGCTLVHMGQIVEAQSVFNKAMCLCREHPQYLEHQESIQNTINSLNNSFS